ncbi:carbon monoxide dehydrogenase [Geothermobacter hydrogeniphilus]|uniref:Carbon monoxide dehydrogenase n=1 Tax=Geothermobacter hydrogeniphilus TaxID=1969733 RepID=A0A2K2H806_9BACT|nr:carbon monoxide dehydrogenase [Geothermobacter hydrogeniphilus]
MPTTVGDVPQVRTELAAADHAGRLLMRWGIGRDRYRIAPGLYAIGRPDAHSEVLVSANYKLSFDMLRRELAGRNLWLLVLETYGVNVWCAAGKGTFGTEEIISRVRTVGLEQVVKHRRLIVPQLGAPGVAAHEVKRDCGFRVIYGPVRATDLPGFLDNDFQASAEMRRVRFSTFDRLVLTPVELTGLGKSTLYALLAVLLLGGIGPSIFSFDGLLHRGGGALLVFLAGLFSGAVVTPLLLPWLPWRAFAAKGALVGAVTALLMLLVWGPALGGANGLALLLAVPAVSSWYAMNFTGSSTYTSPSGVEKEMRRAIPFQAAALLIAAGCWLWAAF